MTIANFWFLLSNLDKQISLKFMWYMSIKKIQVEFEKGRYALSWTKVIASDRCENCKFFVSGQHVSYLVQINRFV